MKKAQTPLKGKMPLINQQRQANPNTNNLTQKTLMTNNNTGNRGQKRPHDQTAEMSSSRNGNSNHYNNYNKMAPTTVHFAIRQVLEPKGFTDTYYKTRKNLMNDYVRKRRISTKDREQQNNAASESDRPDYAEDYDDDDMNDYEEDLFEQGVIIEGNALEEQVKSGYVRGIKFEALMYKPNHIKPGFFSTTNERCVIKYTGKLPCIEPYVIFEAEVVPARFGNDVKYDIRKIVDINVQRFTCNEDPRNWQEMFQRELFMGMSDSHSASMRVKKVANERHRSEVELRSKADDQGRRKVSGFVSNEIKNCDFQAVLSEMQYSVFLNLTFYNIHTSFVDVIGQYKGLIRVNMDKFYKRATLQTITQLKELIDNYPWMIILPEYRSRLFVQKLRSIEELVKIVEIYRRIHPGYEGAKETKREPHSDNDNHINNNNENDNDDDDDDNDDDYIEDGDETDRSYTIVRGFQIDSGDRERHDRSYEDIDTFTRTSNSTESNYAIKYTGNTGFEWRDYYYYAFAIVNHFEKQRSKNAGDMFCRFSDLFMAVKDFMYMKDKIVDTFAEHVFVDDKTKKILYEYENCKIACPAFKSYLTWSLEWLCHHGNIVIRESPESLSRSTNLFKSPRGGWLGDSDLDTLRFYKSTTWRNQRYALSIFSSFVRRIESCTPYISYHRDIVVKELKRRIAMQDRSLYPSSLDPYNGWNKSDTVSSLLVKVPNSDFDNGDYVIQSSASILYSKIKMYKELVYGQIPVGYNDIYHGIIDDLPEDLTEEDEELLNYYVSEEQWTNMQIQRMENKHVMPVRDPFSSFQRARGIKMTSEQIEAGMSMIDPSVAICAVVGPPGVGKTLMIEFLIHAYPEANILIVTLTGKMANTHRERFGINKQENERMRQSKSEGVVVSFNTTEMEEEERYRRMMEMERTNGETVSTISNANTNNNGGGLLAADEDEDDEDMQFINEMNARIASTSGGTSNNTASASEENNTHSAISTRKGKVMAMTIHSACEKINKSFELLKIVEEEGIQFVVVDEGQNKDMSVTNRTARLLYYCGNGLQKVVLLGDPDQIEPIGQGRPFTDICLNRHVYVTRLTKNQRVCHAEERDAENDGENNNNNNDGNDNDRNEGGEDDEAAIYLDEEDGMETIGGREETIGGGEETRHETNFAKVDFLGSEVDNVLGHNAEIMSDTNTQNALINQVSNYMYRADIIDKNRMDKRQLVHYRDSPFSEPPLVERLISGDGRNFRVFNTDKNVEECSKRIVALYATMTDRFETICVMTARKASRTNLHQCIGNKIREVVLTTGKFAVDSLDGDWKRCNLPGSFGIGIGVKIRITRNYNSCLVPLTEDFKKMIMDRKKKRSLYEKSLLIGGGHKEEELSESIWDENDDDDAAAAATGDDNNGEGATNTGSPSRNQRGAENVEAQDEEITRLLTEDNIMNGPPPVAIDIYNAKNYGKEGKDYMISYHVENGKNDWIQDIRMFGERGVYFCKLLNENQWICIGPDHIDYSHVTVGYVSTIDSQMGSEYDYVALYMDPILDLEWTNRNRLLVACTRAKKATIILSPKIDIAGTDLSKILRNREKNAKRKYFSPPLRNVVTIDTFTLLQLVYTNAEKRRFTDFHYYLSSMIDYDHKDEEEGSFRTHRPKRREVTSAKEEAETINRILDGSHFEDSNHTLTASSDGNHQKNGTRTGTSTNSINRTGTPENREGGDDGDDYDDYNDGDYNDDEMEDGNSQSESRLEDNRRKTREAEEELDDLIDIGMQEYQAETVATGKQIDREAQENPNGRISVDHKEDAVGGDDEDDDDDDLSWL